VRRPSRWLAAPLAAYLTVFLLYPTAHAVVLGLTDGTTGAFPSLASFREVAHDALFWRALAGNLALPAATVAIELVSGLGLALLLAGRLPARRLLRTLVLVPFALPEIVFLTIVREMLAPRGYVNGALAVAGLAPLDWVAPGSASAYLCVVAVDAWRTTPVVFLVLLAALAAIPDEIHEAARLDGARGLRRLWHVTIPLLRPALYAALLLRGVDALRIFATPLVLAGAEGVPVLSTYAYQQWADAGSDTTAAAAACVLAALCTACFVPLLRSGTRSA
jgi:multiple sugar transport system permease protein